MRLNDKYYMSKSKNDYNTPIEAWILLIQNMRKVKGLTFWLPFYNDGSIKKEIVKHTDDINIIHHKTDFYSYEPEQYDIIADNPPYNNKEFVLKRCLELGKPFALLLPMETMERQFFSDMFKNDKLLQVIIPRRRYEFSSKYANSQGKVPFKSVWITYNMNLKSKNNVIFE